MKKLYILTLLFISTSLSFLKYDIKDLLQLINDKVHMRSSKKGMQDYTTYTPEYLEETMGVTPELMTDLKGLMGDASDNLPGIPGVGEKTAETLKKNKKLTQSSIKTSFTKL